MTTCLLTSMLLTITMWVNVVGEGQNDLRVFSEGNTENSNPLFNIEVLINGGADGSVDFYSLRQSGWTTFWTCLFRAAAF